MSPSSLTIVDRALELIPADGTIGLGSGHAATDFIHALGKRVQAGLRIHAVPTSLASADLARSLGISLTSLDEVDELDITIDGADEVDENRDLIKGYGGALLRERIVAVASRRLVILVGPEKLVPVLGSRGILPVEVVPFALGFCSRRIQKMGYTSEPRRHEGRLFITDNGNCILDCRIHPLPKPAMVDQALRAIPGVVGTGLFLDMATTVLIQQAGSVEIRERRDS